MYSVKFRTSLYPTRKFLQLQIELLEVTLVVRLRLDRPPQENPPYVPDHAVTRFRDLLDKATDQKLPSLSGSRNSARRGSVLTSKTKRNKENRVDLLILLLLHLYKKLTGVF